MNLKKKAYGSNKVAFQRHDQVLTLSKLRCNSDHAKTHRQSDVHPNSFRYETNNSDLQHRQK
jgi:hypothetical protein